MAEIVFSLTLSGAAITPEGYPLEDVNRIAISLAALLERRVNQILAENRVARTDTTYEVRASFPQYGSFDQQLVIFLKQFASNHPVIVAMSVLIPSINSVFSLYDNFKKRLPSKPKIEKNSQGELIVAGGNEPLKVDPSTFQQLVDEPEFRDILKRLAPKRIESLEFSHGGTKIKVTGSSGDAPLWRAIRKLRKEVERTRGGQTRLRADDTVEQLVERIFAKPAEVTGTIRAVDLDARTGRLHVEQGAEVPQGDYDFRLSSEAKPEELKTHVGGRVRLFIHSMSVGTSAHRPSLVVSRISGLGLASTAATT
jgi:hypothetical protein